MTIYRYPITGKILYGKMVNGSIIYFLVKIVCGAVLWFLVLSVVLRLGYCQGLTFGLSFLFVFELSGFRFGNCIRGPWVKIDISSSK